MQKEKIDAQDVIKQIIEGIQDKKGKGIVVVDMLKLGNSVCDYFVICTVANNPMMDAVVEEIEEKVRLNCQEKPLSVEGRAGATWLLVDYGAVVIHVFREESREFYRLEELWADAPMKRYEFGE